MDFRSLVLVNAFLVLFLQVNTLKSALEGVERERDYYFSKLREVELLCQEQSEENAPFVDRLMEILYPADEQVGPQGSLNCFSSLEVVLVVPGVKRGSITVVKSCVVRPEKNLCICAKSHDFAVVFLEAFMSQFSIFDIQEGAELAEGNGEEVEQQTQEEGGDDQQEEQDEY